MDAEVEMQAMKTQSVTLEQVLQTKEERAAVQAELRSRYQAAVVSVSLNMPGPAKYDQDSLDLIEYALNRLQDLFAASGAQPSEMRRLPAVAGPAAVLAVEADAALLKQLAVQVEEEQPFCRLLDIDVFDAAGGQLSRDAAGPAGRRCFVCDEPAILCIRGRRHDAQAVADAVAKMVEQYHVYNYNSEYSRQR
jgi:holo-ACP synthase CitX